MPTYTIKGKNVISIGSFKNWSCLWFHNGSFLEDKNGVMHNAQEGKTKGMRQWRFKNSEEINEQLVREYLQEAINNQLQGKEVKPSKTVKEAIPIPVLLKTHLDLTLSHLKTFNEFTVSQQNEFSNYIIDAKRMKTKLDRMEKIKDLLESKRTLNSQWQG
jgi:uncharacterized protein YdeI (YjbR/CyaY-like superfamily)